VRAFYGNFFLENKEENFRLLVNEGEGPGQRSTRKLPEDKRTTGCGGMNYYLYQSRSLRRKGEPPQFSADQKELTRKETVWLRRREKPGGQ